MIENRIRNDFYRRYDAFIWDLELLYTNAYSYNRPNSEIVKNALLIKKLLSNMKSRRYNWRRNDREIRASMIVTSDSSSDSNNTEETERFRIKTRKKSKRLNIYRGNP